MPVKACRDKDQPGFKWGDEGKCFIYVPGNRESKLEARTKAVKQGQAIEASKQEFE